MRAALAVAALACAAIGLPAGAAPSLGGCPVFPPNSIWNARVDALPVHPQSAAWVATIGSAKPLHPDFGTVYAGAPNGIPYVVVPPGTPKVSVAFDYTTRATPVPIRSPRIRRSRAAPRRAATATC